MDEKKLTMESPPGSQYWLESSDVSLNAAFEELELGAAVLVA